MTLSLYASVSWLLWLVEQFNCHRPGLGLGLGLGMGLLLLAIWSGLRSVCGVVQAHELQGVSPGGRACVGGCLLGA